MARPRSAEVARRDDRIYAAWKEGATLQQLAERHGITPQRCGQIIAARHPELEEDTDRGVARGRLDNLAAQVQEVIAAPGWKLTPRGDIAVDEDGEPIVDVMSRIEAMKLQLAVYESMRKLDARDRIQPKQIQFSFAEADQARVAAVAAERARIESERARLEELARRAGQQVIQGEIEPPGEGEG